VTVVLEGVDGVALFQKNEKSHFTYSDYLSWPDEERWELIDGVPYNITPAPSLIHQRILGQFYRRFADHLEGKTCEAFLAPFDVRLPKGDESDEKTDTVVQPDLTVICDPSKLDEKGCRGVPDLIVEVLSPFTAHKDMKTKRYLYEKVGVKEYWIILPSERSVMVFSLQENGLYSPYEVYSNNDTIEVRISDPFTIDLASIFAAPHQVQPEQ